ncbi:MAG: hypothetical protein ACM31L_07235 [Actinomycetota bacterium]
MTKLVTAAVVPFYKSPSILIGCIIAARAFGTTNNINEINIAQIAIAICVALFGSLFAAGKGVYLYDNDDIKVVGSILDGDPWIGNRQSYTIRFPKPGRIEISNGEGIRTFTGVRNWSVLRAHLSEVGADSGAR